MQRSSICLPPNLDLYSLPQSSLTYSTTTPSLYSCRSDYLGFNTPWSTTSYTNPFQLHSFDSPKQSNELTSVNNSMDGCPLSDRYQTPRSIPLQSPPTFSAFRDYEPVPRDYAVQNSYRDLYNNHF